MILDFACCFLRRLLSFPQHHACSNDHSADLIRHAHNGALKHFGMVGDDSLEFNRRNVVARGNDDVVLATHVPETTIGVLVKHVRGDVPAVADEIPLILLVSEVAAAGGSAYREETTPAWRDHFPLLVQ